MVYRDCTDGRWLFQSWRLDLLIVGQCCSTSELTMSRWYWPKMADCKLCNTTLLNNSINCTIFSITYHHHVCKHPPPSFVSYSSCQNDQGKCMSLLYLQYRILTNHMLHAWAVALGMEDRNNAIEFRSMPTPTALCMNLGCSPYFLSFISGFVKHSESLKASCV